MMHARTTNSRQHREIKVLEVRSLAPDDLELLRRPIANTATLRTYRDRHHHMAFLVALGKPTAEICSECKVSPARLSQHKAAPGFQNLIGKYRAEVEASRIAALREFGAVAAENMLDAELILQKEIRAVRAGEAQTPPLRDLNRIATDRMDRFGYPKKTLTDSRSVNVNFAAKLEAAIARGSKGPTP